MSTKQKVRRDIVQAELASWFLDKSQSEHHWRRDDFLRALEFISIEVHRQVSDKEKCKALYLLFKKSAANKDSCADIYLKALNIACKLAGITIQETYEQTA